MCSREPHADVLRVLVAPCRGPHRSCEVWGPQGLDRCFSPRPRVQLAAPGEIQRPDLNHVIEEMTENAAAWRTTMLQLSMARTW